MKILHPLPRLSEIDVLVDGNHRAKYFEQVKYGKFVRMALILKLLEGEYEEKEEKIFLNDKKCSNTCCVVNDEFNVTQYCKINSEGKKICKYCDEEIK